MDLFELSATLWLDTSAYESGLSGALGVAKKVLGEIADLAVDFGKDVLKTGMGFDKEMSAVQAVLGKTEGTVENMNRLRAFALDQARDSIFTAEQTAEAYYYMGMAGWKTEEMLGGLPGIMALAAASGEDLGMVSDIVTDSLTAFGWEANRASEFADILAQAATNSNTDVKRMGETFKYIAPIAGSLGVEVEDVALSIGLLASQGIKGSMAGTALRNILVRLATNAGQTNKDLGALTILTEKLGVQFWDSSGKMRDFSDIIREARVSWQGLTQEEQTYYAKQIGSQRGMAAWMALMNAAEEDVNQLAYAFANAEGAAQGMADVKLDNLWGDIQMFNSSLDVLKVALFDDVKSPLREVVQYGTDALDRIRDAIEEDGLIGGLKQLGTEIKKFGTEYKDEIEAFGESIGSVLVVLVDAVAPALVEAGSKLGAGLLEGVGEGLAKSENPILGLLGTVIGGAGYSLEGIVNLFTGGKSFAEYWLGNPEEFANSVDEIVAPGMEGYGHELDNYAELMGYESGTYFGQGAIDGATDFLNGDTGVQDGLVSEYIEAGKDGGSAMQANAESSAIDYLKNAEGLSRNIVAMYDAAGLDGGWKMGSNIFTAVTSIGGAIGNSLVSTIGSAGTNAGNAFANAMQSVFNRVQLAVNVVQRVSQAFAGFPVKRNATAMATGRIFKSPTIFGFDGGEFQLAGDAGPEAVIGTNSLANLITKAVERGNAGQMYTVPRGTDRPVRVIFEIDGAQKAVYNLNRAEEQRVGIRLAGGLL